LGVEYASQVHVSDFELMKERDEQNITYRTKMQYDDSSNDSSTNCSERFIGKFPLQDCFNVMIDSFDLFLNIIMEKCEIDTTIRENTFEFDHGVLLVIDGSKSNIIEEKKKESKPDLSVTDGGKAILQLGTFLEENDYFDDALNFFHHALYLFLLDAGTSEPRLLNNSERCHSFAYSNIAMKPCSTFTSPNISYKYEHLGFVLTKIGDVHGKNIDLDNALEAYNASQLCWNKHSTTKNCEVNNTNKKCDVIKCTTTSNALALVHTRIGGIFISKGNLRAALKSLQEALRLQIEVLGTDYNIEVAKTFHNIGVCHRHNNEWDEALEYYKRAEIIFADILGRCHLDTVRTLHNIGGIYRRLEKYEKAMHCFKEVYKIRRKILGDNHPSVAITLISMAVVLRRSGQKEVANKFFAAAVR
jgi:tetratricopeptide (TPR) repeat protein